MRGNKHIQILAIVGSVLIIFGISLMCWILLTEEERNVIEIQLDYNKTETIEFADLSLVPGESCEYTVKLGKFGADRYDLSIDFVEKDDKTLKDFVRVKLYADGELVSDELLRDAFENEDIVLPVNYATKQNTELTIVYYLPLDVGNAAKHASTDFELRLKASNE